MQSRYDRYYELLGVGPEATRAQLRRAYRKAVKKYHPDLYTGRDHEAAERRFMQLTDAYRALHEMAGRKATIQVQSTTMGLSPQELASRGVVEDTSSFASRTGLLRLVRLFQSRSGRTQAALATLGVLALAVVAYYGILLHSGAVDVGGFRSARVPAKGPAVRLKLPGGVAMELVRVPEGTFPMGPYGDSESEGEALPAQATLEKPLYLARTEVTQAQWQAVMGTRPWAGKDRVRLDPNQPATHLALADILRFCQALSQRSEHAVRLPTGLEWERACRAGGQGRFCFGDDDEALGDYAWYNANASDPNADHPRAVAGRKPNAWGLYDMHGNVWEWCARPVGGVSGRRYIRGGSYSAGSRFCRSASRAACSPAARSYDIGFRVAIDAD